jgi:solute carrier family 25 oxoglutarate transporter 11
MPVPIEVGVAPRAPAKTALQKAMPFFLGGLAGSLSTCVIQPLDMVKVRLQLSGELGAGTTVRSPIAMARIIYKKEGARRFVRAVDAHQSSHPVFCATRLEQVCLLSTTD